jgi:hypothetical protein
VKPLVSISVLCAALALATPGCKGKSKRDSTSGGEGAAVDDQGRCPHPDDDPRHLEVSVYDTNGNGTPDVRKVYLVFESGRDRRTVLICREADLNGDGIKDMVRFYDDEGSPVREESDRNFDGRIDVVTHFDAGQVVVKELDENFDGRIETKLFYENGRTLRIERDLAGHDPKVFRTDRWEYVEGGRIVRIGTDLDGDGKVDRWDRDTEVEHARREEELRRLREEGAADDESAEDDAVEHDEVEGDSVEEDAADPGSDS